MRRLVLAGIFFLLVLVPAQLAAPAPGAQAAFSGDYNCDAAIDALDALTALRVGANLQALPGCADPASVDCDGQTDAVDALFILRYTAQLPVTLPVGCPDVGAVTPGTPPGVAGTDLAKSVSNAPDDEARYQALLQVMEVLRIGVYTSEGGEVQQGAERGPGDLYFYDFELRMLAASLGRKDTSWGVQQIADTLDQVGYREDGQPFTGDNLNQILHDATNDSLAKPEEESSLVPMLVRELGLRHEPPYDLAVDLDVNEAQFDGLQVTLILAGLTLPEIAGEGPFDTPASTLVGNSNGILTAQPVGVTDFCSDFKDEGSELWGPTKYFLTTVGKIGAVAKKGVAFIDIIHGEQLAYSVQVKAVGEIEGSTHYDHGPEEPGALRKFSIEVRMLDDLGETLVKCGWLATADYPPPGGIPGVRVQFNTFASGLEQHGTLDCTGTFCSRTTDSNGIATLTFDPKSETAPYGQGLEVEATGSLEAIAWYQSRFRNLFGTLAQFVTPKTDWFAWSVKYHGCAFEISPQSSSAGAAQPLAASAALPCAYEGTASATDLDPFISPDVSTITASNLRFELQPPPPGSPPGEEAVYELVRGNVTVQVSSTDGGCTWSGGFSIPGPIDDGVHYFGGIIVVDPQTSKYRAGGSVNDTEHHVVLTCSNAPYILPYGYGAYWLRTTIDGIPNRSFTPGGALEGSFDWSGAGLGDTGHSQWSFHPAECQPSPQPVCQ